MSHFTVTVVLPKEGLEKLEGREFEGKEEWQNAYDHQGYHPQLEQMLEPYFEQHEEGSVYVERDIDRNFLASDVMEAYKGKDWEKLNDLITDWKERRTKWMLSANRYETNEETGELEKKEVAKAEIDTMIEPYDNLYSLMASEKFDINIEAHLELIRDCFCDSEELVVDYETGEIFDVWYRNPNAKWDWWVVGGRWRNMGDNGLFKDISVFSQEEKIPFWKEELGFKLKQIESELGIEDRNELSSKEYDELIEDYISSGNPIVRFYDRDTKEPKEYYDKKDLLKTVSRKKESTWAMLFPDEGWIEAGEMGWFGMSSLDNKDFEEREQILQDQNKLTDNLIEKYKDTHIGLVVDCHI